MTEDDGYLLDNRRAEAGERFDALAELFDDSTFRHFDALGLGPGHHVWEVGAGGLSVPRGLAERVGPQGRVLASDLDTAWLSGAEPPPNVEVRRHDIGQDQAPAGPFDFVHARLVVLC
ncbi:class I SAM-dependent methyltransferase [Streptomyces sp. NPDC006704]|uniref:class I SAM-dependent methyltransferase n=1 Tax=Streptomyces sp. NPDC006704 TaxID=3364760 RepID=UPI0036C1D252